MALLRWIHSGSAVGDAAAVAAGLGTVLQVFDRDCAPQAPSKSGKTIDHALAHLVQELISRTLGGRALGVKRPAANGSPHAGSVKTVPREARGLDAERHDSAPFGGDAAGAFA